MSEDVSDQEAAIALVKEYAASECVGRFGDVTDVEEREAEWFIKFHTSTSSDTHTHRVRITKSVGNVISHDRSSRFE